MSARTYYFYVGIPTIALTLFAPLTILRQFYSPTHSLSETCMVKLIALYRKPADIAAFDKHYFDVHIPLVKKTPGLRKIEVTRITGAPMGETKYHLMAELYYDSVDAMNAANASPEGRASAKDLMSSAADVVTLFFGEIDK